MFLPKKPNFFKPKYLSGDFRILIFSRVSDKKSAMVNKKFTFFVNLCCNSCRKWNFDQYTPV